MDIPDLLDMLKAVRDEIIEAEIALRLHKAYLAKIYLEEAVGKLNLCLERI